MTELGDGLEGDSDANTEAKVSISVVAAADGVPCGHSAEDRM